MKFDSLVRGSFDQCCLISGKPKIDQTNFVYSRRFNVAGGNKCCKRICYFTFIRPFGYHKNKVG